MQTRTFGCVCNAQLCGLTLDLSKGFSLYSSQTKVYHFLSHHVLFRSNRIASDILIRSATRSCRTRKRALNFYSSGVVLCSHACGNFQTKIEVLTIFTFFIKKVNTFPIPKLHQFQLLCLIHKFLYERTCLSLVFKNYFVHNNSIHNYNICNKHNLHLSSVHSEYGKRYIKFKASNLWNKLPENFKKTSRRYLHSKKSLRSFLLNADI